MMGMEDEDNAKEEAKVVDRNEIDLYLDHAAIPPQRIDENPLEWWELNQHRFPRLAYLARRFLCIQATSAPIERVWSAGGNIVTDKRRSLSPDNVERHIFMCENARFLPEE
jgi:hypothetical protein